MENKERKADAPEFRTIYGKLAYVQQNCTLKKENHNPEAGFNYWRLDDMLSAAVPWLAKVGLFIDMSYAPLCLEGWHYIEVTATVTDVETGQQYFRKGYAREQEHKAGMDDSQISCSAGTYAAKMALAALLGLTTGFKEPDDMDNTREHTGKRQETAPQERQQHPMTRDEALSVELPYKGSMTPLEKLIELPNSMKLIANAKKQMESRGQTGMSQYEAVVIIYNYLLGTVSA